MSNVDDDGGGRMMELNDLLLFSSSSSLRTAIRNSTFAFVRSPWTTTRRRDKKTKGEKKEQQ